MKTMDILLQNETGLHARPASEFVKLAKSFEAKITLVKGDLNGIVKAKNLSHAVMSNIKQNLFFAFIYNVFLGIEFHGIDAVVSKCADFCSLVKHCGIDSPVKII